MSPVCRGHDMVGLVVPGQHRVQDMAAESPA